MKTYKNALDKIKASDGFKQETINLLVNNKRENKKFRLAPIAAIAASLAVVIALGAVFLPLSKGNDSFIITANAMEINKNSFTTIGELPAYGWKTDVDKSEIYTIADFMLQVKGENIKEVTYSIKNGAFAIPDRNKKPITSKEIGANVCVPKREDKSFYSEVTTAYDNQIDAINDNVEIVFNPAKIDKNVISIAERWGEIADLSSNAFVYDTNKEIITDYQEAAENFFNTVVKDCTIEVKVKYSDGSTETQKLTYKADVEIGTAPLSIHTKNGYETKDAYFAKINLTTKLV